MSTKTSSSDILEYVFFLQPHFLLNINTGIYIYIYIYLYTDDKSYMHSPLVGGVGAASHGLSFSSLIS